MRRLLTAAAAAAVVLVPAGTAQAAAGQLAPVLVLEDGHVHVKRERFLGPTALPATPAPTPRTAVAAAAKKKPPRGRATRVAIDALLAQGAIDQAARDARQASLRQTLRVYKGLSGTRKLELGAVIDNADTIARSQQLTSSRLNAVFATLEANRSWWSNGSIPAPGAGACLVGTPVV